MIPIDFIHTTIYSYGMKKTKVSAFTLSDSTKAILDDIAIKGGNRSGYISQLVQDASVRRQAAARHCQDAGITRPFLRMCYGLLNGRPKHFGMETPDGLKFDVETAGAVLHEKYDLTTADVQRQVALLSWPTFRAIVALSDEYWAGNTLA